MESGNFRKGDLVVFVHSVPPIEGIKLNDVGIVSGHYTLPGLKEENIPPQGFVNVIISHLGIECIVCEERLELLEK